MIWRVGEHYRIHVYEGERPVATFHTVLDAEKAVEAVNAEIEQADHDAGVQEVIEAAGALLARLENMTSREFSHGGERDERNRLREALEAHRNAQ